jgi:simple sugar transport system permease protein
VVAAILGLAAGVAVTALAGENPLTVLIVLLKGAFGSPYDFGMTLFYATPLILTGLAVAVPFRAGLFNVGAEGQLTVGAMATAVTALAVGSLPPALGATLATLAGVLAGALWGAIPGWLRAYRGGHEVISTIMLNFVAAGLTSWVTLYLVPSLDSQNPESARIEGALLLAKAPGFGGAPVTVALPLALGAAVLVWAFQRYTVRGYEMTAAGLSPDAASASGIDGRALQASAMALAGALAGLVGLAEVLGSAGRFRIGFSPDYGFVGIPVALLARAHPLGVVAAALLFGALQKGTADLDLETSFVTRDLALIIQALVVLAVSAEGGLGRLVHRRRRAA